jgi:20S proteasome alpha/beta subunit
MTLTTILTGEDPNKGKFLVFGADSRGETYFPSTSDRMVKYYKINERAGMIFAGYAHLANEMVDLVMADPSISESNKIYDVATKVAEKYCQVWEKHIKPKRMQAEAYRMPMGRFSLNVGLGGLDVKPKIYLIEEAGECIQVPDEFTTLGSGTAYAKPRIEDWLRCAGAEVDLPGIPKLSLNSAIACTYYVIEDAKKKTSQVGGKTHISVITSEGWRDLNEELREFEPEVLRIMKRLDETLTEEIKLIDERTKNK